MLPKDTKSGLDEAFLELWCLSETACNTHHRSLHHSCLASRLGKCTPPPVYLCPQKELHVQDCSIDLHTSRVSSMSTICQSLKTIYTVENEKISDTKGQSSKSRQGVLSMASGGQRCRTLDRSQKVSVS